MNWANIFHYLKTFCTYLRQIHLWNIYILNENNGKLYFQWIFYGIFDPKRSDTYRVLSKNQKTQYFTAFFSSKTKWIWLEIIQKLPKNILRGKCIHVVNESIGESSWYVARLMNFGLRIFWDFFEKIFQFDLVPNWQFLRFVSISGI